MTGTLHATDEVNRVREEEVREDGKRERGGMNCERFRIENKTRREKVLFCSSTFFTFLSLPISPLIGPDKWRSWLCMTIQGDV